MLNKENLESLMAMLDHFGQVYAVTIDPYDDIPLISSNYQEVWEWIDRYDYDRVDICRPHLILSIQEGNNATLMVTLFEDHKQRLHFSTHDISLIHHMVYNWLYRRI